MSSGMSDGGSASRWCPRMYSAPNGNRAPRTINIHINAAARKTCSDSSGTESRDAIIKKGSDIVMASTCGYFMRCSSRSKMTRSTLVNMGLKQLFSSFKKEKSRGRSESATVSSGEREASIGEGVGYVSDARVLVVLMILGRNRNSFSVFARSGSNGREWCREHATLTFYRWDV